LLVKKSIALLLMTWVFSCGAAEQSNNMKITSSAFQEGKEIPSKYTCEGDNISPPLQWEGIPQNTKSLALIVDDPDAPDPKAPKMVWVHWVLYNLEPKSQGLSENIQSNQMPTGTIAGTTSWNNSKYGGPCPPIGRHRYYHRLYALDTKLEDNAALSSDDLKAKMQGHVIAEAVLMGTYQKKK